MWLEAMWLGGLVLESGGNFVFHHANKMSYMALEMVMNMLVICEFPQHCGPTAVLPHRKVKKTIQTVSSNSEQLIDKGNLSDIPIKLILEIKNGKKGLQKQDRGSIWQASVIVDCLGASIYD